MTDLKQMQTAESALTTDLSETVAIAAWKGLVTTTGLPSEEAVTMRYRDWARVLGLYLPVYPPALPLYFGKDYSKVPIQLIVHYRSSDRVAVALREECLAANEPIQFMVNDTHTINWLRLAEDDGKANFWAQLHLRMRPVTIWPISSHLHVKIIPANSAAFDAKLKSVIDGDNEALHSIYREGEAKSNLKLKCTQSNMNYFLSCKTKSTPFRGDLKALFLNEPKQQIISGVTSVCEQLLDELNDFRERMPTMKKDGLANDECEAFLLVFMHSKIASTSKDKKREGDIGPQRRHAVSVRFCLKVRESDRFSSELHESNRTFELRLPEISHFVLGLGGGFGIDLSLRKSDRFRKRLHL